PLRRHPIPRSHLSLSVPLQPPRPTLFPYTTLFRSRAHDDRLVVVLGARQILELDAGVRERGHQQLLHFLGFNHGGISGPRVGSCPRSAPPAAVPPGARAAERGPPRRRLRQKSSSTSPSSAV